MSFYPVSCARCLKVIDLMDAHMIPGPVGVEAYCNECIEGVLVDEDPRGDEQIGEEQRWLEEDPGFAQWLEFIDKKGEEDAEPHRNEG